VTRTWLGLDTSISAFGFAVMARNIYGAPFLVRGGVWLTKIDHSEGKLDDRARRIADLCHLLIELVDTEKPSEVYVEDLALGMKTSRGTAQTMGRVRGIAEMLCAVRKLELAAIRPDVLKKACTGRRDASKEQVRDVVSKIYGIAPGADLNATDAVACAHVGAHRFGHGVEVTSGVVKYQPPAADGDELDF
jgi:Holliday junction resolvasome RuvABC endonuclease subunit